MSLTSVEKEKKIGIFAAEDVGYEICKYFKEMSKNVTMICLDNCDSMGINSKIRSLNITNKYFFSDAIYQEKNIQLLKTLNLDLNILAWWPYIIKKPLFQISRFGFLNFHPSYLPFNRGKHYYFWNMVEAVPFGVSLHHIDENIDSGPIAYQKRIETSWVDTGNSLRERAKREIVELFKENFEQIISGDIPRIEQDKAKGSFHYSSEIEKASQINLDKNYSGRELLNLLRARSGFPEGGCWFIDGEKKFEITITIKEV